MDTKKYNQIMYKVKTKAQAIINYDDATERSLHSLSYVRGYSKEKQEMGEKWFNDGHSIEEASQEFKDDIQFKLGYDRAKRQKYIKDLLEEKEKLKLENSLDNVEKGKRK